MKNALRILVTLGLPLAVGDCVKEPTPVQRATTFAQFACSDPVAAREGTRILEETTVLKVEPISFVAGASTRSEGVRTLSGTKLYLHAPERVSVNAMTRALSCHRAEMLLHPADPAANPDDPFALPNTWVEFDVKDEQGFMVARVSADRVWQNVALLRRATAFADEHRPVLRGL